MDKFNDSCIIFVKKIFKIYTLTTLHLLKREFSYSPIKILRLTTQLKSWSQEQLFLTLDSKDEEENNDQIMFPPLRAHPLKIKAWQLSMKTKTCVRAKKSTHSFVSDLIKSQANLIRSYIFLKINSFVKK